MTIKSLYPILEELAPLGYAEDFDNVGLIIGQPDLVISGILVCHDALEEVVQEAIEKKCNLIVCFHPILFNGLKKITGKTYVERAVMKALKNDIAIYALHTALDNHQWGVNHIFCETLGIKNPKMLVEKQNYIQKLVVFTPADHADKLRHALFSAGAGQIGNYDHCSFSSTGTGSYRGNENSNPVIGAKNELVETAEVKIEVTFEKHLQNQIISAMKANHVYEEVAYEIYSLENKHQNIGLGMIGNLEIELSENDFLNLIKQKLDLSLIKHSKKRLLPIKKVAVLGGSGSFAISQAIALGADAFLTADLKYHQFYEAENRLLLVDVGHYESEKFTKNIIFDYLKKKITNFAVVLSEIDTNPVKYF
jgi:dinuclear metal center YbgI/SA1388 family protein